MNLQLQDFSTMVKTQAAAVSNSCKQVIDMTVGSVVRSILEANASVGLWIQWLIVQVLAATRAATSTGSDLDSWVADFGMSRFEAVTAAGSVTFSRITTGIATTILPGMSARTGLSANDQVFVVITDTSHPSWNGTGYALGAADASVVVRVVAKEPGAAGNVVAGAITTIGSAIPGIDTVVNTLAMTGGFDAESDVALRARFSAFLDSRNRATVQAVGFAIASVKQGLTYTVADRVDPSGATRPGHFTITVDDGTGAPGSDLIAEIASAVDLVRPIGTTFSVRPPLVIPISIAMHAIGPDSAKARIVSAVTGHVAALPIGAPLTVTRLYQIAYGADTSVTNVSGALINGAASDYVPPIYGMLRPSSVAVL